MSLSDHALGIEWDWEEWCKVGRNAERLLSTSYTYRRRYMQSDETFVGADLGYSVEIIERSTLPSCITHYL